MNNFEIIEHCGIYALIVAGGNGLRMESAIRKQYIKISGIPLLARTIGVFSSFDSIAHIVVVVPEEDVRYCFENIISPYSFNDRVCIVSGGKERQHSVMNGLKKVRELASLQHGFKIVLIHDGVRPFVDHEIINRCIEGAVKHGACIPVISVSDTLKRGDGNGFVAKGVDRNNLYQVQTPQAFNLDLIINAHEQALLSDFSATDDSSLVEQLRKKVFMTSGSIKNIKITTKEDLIFAEYMLSISTTGYSY
ncbi:MAG: 2-C-methyl-D-erythritol 4-phosphate cytidylyltransferase [Desulfamplus sp.]|nr:2-C-methyl-D-erythritol 4-phosphate cytidylyltransferase [Desulfamplus sp.]